MNILPISSAVESIPYSSQDILRADADPDDEAASADLSGTYLDPELEQLKASLSDTPKVIPVALSYCFHSYVLAILRRLEVW